MIDFILERALKEIAKTDLLNESERYTDEELLDMVVKDPEKEESLIQDDGYADIIKRLKEGGLI